MNPAALPTPPLLDVDSLVVSFKQSHARGRHGSFRAVDRVSFQVGHGETLALVGESGSGKSTTARGILRLIEPESGAVRLDGVDILAVSHRDVRRMRSRMQMVFQDPYSSLNPAMLIGESIAEPLRVHTDQHRRQRRERVRELIEVVGLRTHHLERYPFEFSGGQRQRIAIARALAVDPELVICDEAVSALDVSTQNQIVNLLEDLQAKLGVSYVFISHDLAVVRHIAHRVAVMYLGRIVEAGPVESIFSAPAHPYTRALLSAVPVADPRLQRERQAQRVKLKGDVPAGDRPDGCAFHTRCPEAMAICAETAPPDIATHGLGHVACWLADPSASESVPVRLQGVSAPSADAQHS
ncbi:MAG: ABC transporter ATP-binding protein [Acidimicrobiia bacterium]